MLEGIVRESIDKQSTKKLRQDGYLIANVYAKGVENISCAFDYNDFIRFVKNKETLAFDIKLGKQTLKVIIQDYQRDPVHGTFIHVDLRVVVPGLVSKYLVPVKTIGTPKGLKNRGIFMQNKNRLEVKCKGEDLPNSFDLEVQDLDVGSSILVRDITVPANVTLLEQSTTSIAGVIKA